MQNVSILNMFVVFADQITNNWMSKSRKYYRTPNSMISEVMESQNSEQFLELLDMGETYDILNV